MLKEISPTLSRVAWGIIGGAHKIYTRCFVHGSTAIPAAELTLFTLLKGELSVVFDVGARSDLSFYEIKPACAYHLFEPHQQFVALLKEKIARLRHPNITVNEFGLSDENQENCIYYEETESFVVNPIVQSTKDNGYRYSLKTLDSYVQEQHIQKIDFLKIDAEGLDYKILQGARETIDASKISYIQFEYWDGLAKFLPLLKDYRLYLMIEPRLLKMIRKVKSQMTVEQRALTYTKLLVPVTPAVVDLIDTKLIPREAGGNILAVHHSISSEHFARLVGDAL